MNTKKGFNIYLNLSYSFANHTLNQVHLMSILFYNVKKTIQSSITSIASEMTVEFKKKLPKVFRYGGGISSHTVNIQLNGKQFYDIVLHYLPLVRLPHNQARGLGWSIRTKLLMLTSHVGAESENRILCNLDNTVSKVTGNIFRISKNHSLLSPIVQRQWTTCSVLRSFQTWCHIPIFGLDASHTN